MLMLSCDEVKHIVKNATAVIMYNDIKDQLKTAKKEIERIKVRIARGGYRGNVRIAADISIDA